MKGRLFTGALLAVGLTSAVLTACGTAANSPKDAPAALRADANKSGLQLTLTAQGNEASIPDNGSGLTTAQKQAILNSSLVLTVHAANGTTLSNAGSGGELSLAMDEGGQTLGQLEIVGQTLYLKVDISRIASAYQLDKGQAAKFTSELQQLAPQVPGLSALSAGNWTSIDLGVVNQFTQTLGITLPSGPQMVARLVGAFFNALAQGTPSSANGATQVNVSAQNLVTALAQSISATLSATPGMSKYANDVTAAEGHLKLQGESGNVQVTTSGGSVSALQLPLNQFDKTITGPVSLNMAVADAGPISAPSGATAIDLSKLIHALFAVGSQSTSNTATPITNAG